jgi:iron(III) transport system ATP-binding protein
MEGRFSWPERMRSSGSVLVCIRAESILRISDGEGGANCYDAEVGSMNFLGPVVSCTLRIGEVGLRAELPARHPPSESETIRVRIDPDAAILISEH